MRGGARIVVCWMFVHIGLAAQFTLNTKVQPAGAGTVSGAGTYAAGTRLQITATPAAGYYFTGHG